MGYVEMYICQALSSLSGLLAAKIGTRNIRLTRNEFVKIAGRLTVPYNGEIGHVICTN